MPKKTSKRGGPRPNSGRPATGSTRVHLATRLPPDVVEWLRANGITDTITRLVRRAMKNKK